MGSKRTSYEKRQKERLRQERKRLKAEKRAERKEEKKERPEVVSEEDPDIAGIVPGPQPLPDEDIDPL